MAICAKCGLEKTGADNRCKPCWAAYMRAWYHKPGNMDKAVVSHRKWCEKNPGKQITYCYAWKKRNPDAIKRETKSRWARRKDELKAKAKIARLSMTQEQIDIRNAKVRAKRKANPAPFRARDRRSYVFGNKKEALRNRHFRKKGAVGNYTKAEWEAVCNKQRNRCNHCGLKVKLTRDHIIPIKLGGSNYICNIQGLCFSCNCSKQHMVKAGMQHTLFDRVSA